MKLTKEAVIQVEKWLVDNQNKLANESTDRITRNETKYLLQSKEKVQGIVVEIMATELKNKDIENNLVWIKMVVLIANATITI